MSILNLKHSKMDKVIEYDLDTSGGLMEKIQALIAPPQSSEDQRRRGKKDSESHVRRGGKTINRDCCDACSEGGDLLCCDRCPASFHFACCDPPLEEDEIPAGEWLCNECKHGITQEENQKKEKMDASGEQSTDPVAVEITTLLRGKEQGKPFTQLTQMYKNRNPREFCLPPEMEDFTVFPGDRKTRLSTDGSCKNGKREDEDLEKLCFVCTRYAALSSLAHCDFCPLSFHLDCLNPPMSQLPTGMWMCPNHPDNYVPGLRNQRYSLRVDTINELRSAVNHTGIKLDFIRKAKRSRILMNREKRKIKRTVIPKAIKAQYQCPPYQLLPTYIKEMQRPLPPHVLPVSMPLRKEQDEWLKAIIDMQCEIARELSQPTSNKMSIEDVKNPKGPQSINSCETSKEGHPCKTDKTLSKEGDGPGQGQKLSPNKGSIAGGKPAVSQPLSPQTSLANQPKTTSIKYGMSSTGSSTAAKVIILATQAPFGSVKSSDVASNPSAMSSLSSIASLATNQGKTTVSVGKSSLSVPSLGGSHVISSVNSDMLQDPTLSLLDDRLVRVLAFQRLQQLTGQMKAPSVTNSTPNSNSGKTTSADLQEILDNNKPGGGAIGMLCPVFGLQGPVPMVRKCLYIGSGADNDVSLMSFGHCNFISGKHACIFFDQDTRQFELLNYSEHGSVVDNVLYSCDFTEKQNQSATSGSANYEGKSKFYNVKERNRKPHVDRTTAGFGISSISRPCGCKASGSSVFGQEGAGWEGTAILHHGSYVKFGCLHFVFGMAECTSVPSNRLKSVDKRDVKTDIDVCG